MVKGSSKKRERFTSPGLGLACDVLAGEQYRQRQGLDRGTKLKPFFSNPSTTWGFKPKSANFCSVICVFFMAIEYQLKLALRKQIHSNRASNYWLSSNQFRKTHWSGR